MNATVLADAKTEDTSAMEAPISKRKLMATAEQKRLFDEMFTIEDHVDWKTVSKKLHQNRIKTEKTSPIDIKPSAFSVNIKILHCFSFC